MTLCEPGQQRWSLTLYVSGASPRSTEAIDTIRKICDDDLSGNVDLVVIDVSDEPAVINTDQIIAVPTLVRHLPEPLRQLVGDLSNPERVRVGLDLASRAGPSPRVEAGPRERNDWGS